MTLIDTIDELIKKADMLDVIYVFAQGEELNAKTFAESNAYAKIGKKIEELKRVKEIK